MIYFVRVFVDKHSKDWNRGQRVLYILRNYKKKTIPTGISLGWAKVLCSFGHPTQRFVTRNLISTSSNDKIRFTKEFIQAIFCINLININDFFRTILLLKTYQVCKQYLFKMLFLNGKQRLLKLKPLPESGIGSRLTKQGSFKSKTYWRSVRSRLHPKALQTFLQYKI